MKIIIDIPEEDYKNRTLLNYFKCYSTELDKIIYDGTPVPKGHGRITDIDEVLEDMRATRTYDILFALERVKPIIEADEKN